MRHRTLLVVTPVLLLALSLRLLIAQALPIESDEAIGGLMAKHILQGERPVFYYGQAYMGTLGSYLMALAFALAGISTLTFRLVPIGLSLIFCGLTYALARRIYGPATGSLAALYVGLCPLFLTIWSVKGRVGYVETLVFGDLLPLLLLDIAYDGRRETWRLAVFGLVAGLAFWTNQLILPYVLVVVALLATHLRSSRLRVGALGLAGFAFGSLPLWVANASSGFATLRELAADNAGGASGLAMLPRHLAELGLTAFPVLLGWAQPISDVRLFAAQRSGNAVFFAAGALMAGLLVGLAVWHTVEIVQHGWRCLLTERDVPLLALFFLVPFLFVLSKAAPLHFGEPRYLLPLYSTVPLFAAFLHRLGKRSHLAFALVLVATVGINLWSNLAFDARLSVPVVGGQRLPTSNRELISFLLARQDTRIYADYWIAYSVAFESGERIVAGVLGDDLRRGFNRYIPYAHQVDTSPSPAYVFAAGSPQDLAFGGKLVAGGISYQRSLVGGYAVYDAIDPPQRVLE